MLLGAGSVFQGVLGYLSNEGSGLNHRYSPALGPSDSEPSLSTSVSQGHQCYRWDYNEHEGTTSTSWAYWASDLHDYWIRTTLLHGLAEVRTDWHSIGRRTKEEAGHEVHHY